MEATHKSAIALCTALIYTAVIGVGMYVMHHIYGASYDEPAMMYILWAVEIILTVIAILSVTRFFSWSQVGFGTLQWKELGWLLPAGLLLLTLWMLFFDQLGKVTLTAEQWRLLALTGFTTFLVGFSEEVVYRGIVLHAFLSKGRIFVAMLVSAIAFSLLHSVNVFGGLAVTAMQGQMIATAVFGLAFAPLAIKLKNLWPLIIFHCLWDFVLFVSPLVGADTSLGGLLLFANLLVGLILWIVIALTERKKGQIRLAV